MTSVRPLSDLLRLGAGPLVWFAHLSLTYGAEVVVCRLPDPAPDAIRWFGATTTVLALLALVWFTASSLRQGSPPHQIDTAFLRGVAVLLAGLAALGVIWTALPLAILRACS